MRLGKYLSSLLQPEVDNLYRNCGFVQEDIEILEMLRSRKTYIQIADKMGYSQRTVGRRVCEMKEKIMKARNF